jgi:hypothetical protein
VQKLIQDADHLNHRQLALLSDAIHHPDHVYTYRSHAASHKPFLTSAAGTARPADHTTAGDRAKPARLAARRKSASKHAKLSQRGSASRTASALASCTAS